MQECRAIQRIKIWWILSETAVPSRTQSKDTWIPIVIDTSSVANSSEPSLRVRVRVQTDLLPNWRSGLVMNPPSSSQVPFDGKLPTVLQWAGGQRVAQQIHPSIHKRLLFVEFVNSILSKLRFQQPMICLCMHCSLQYWLIWNQCITFDILYFCVSGWSKIPLWTRRSARCLDYRLSHNQFYWRSVDAHFQHVAGSISLLFLPVKAVNIC